MRPAYDVLVLGDYFYDLIYSGLPEFPELGRELYAQDVNTVGGAMYITAIALHRLGVRVGWPVHFGDDYYSQSVYGFAQCEGLDLTLARHLGHPYRRVTTAMPLHGERAFVTFIDPPVQDRCDYWRHAMERCDFKHLHVGGLEDFMNVLPLVEYARQRGATISTDCQDGPHLHAPDLYLETLALVDVFMPNAREARLLTGRETVQEALESLSRVAGMVVVKDGSCGAWVAHRGEVCHAPSIAAGPVVDTTGAGDCFNAGFLYGLVSQGAPLETCLWYGNICGGLSVTGVGGATNAPTRQQLGEWMAQLTARDGQPL